MQLLFLKKAYFQFLAPLVLLGLILNILALKSPILGLILSLIWLGWAVFAIKGNGFAWIKALWLVLAFLIIANSVVFYIFNLNTLNILLILSVVTIMGFFINKEEPASQIGRKNFISIDRGRIISFLIYLVLYTATGVLLFLNSSAEAIRTPWEVVPKIFFVFYFLLILTLLAVIFIFSDDDEKKNKSNIFLISLHFLLTFLVATIIYKIGFGFDPFVHRAAETALFKLGYLDPKPLYYIGQYSLVIWLSKISFLPIEIIDKFLVPVLAAVSLPTVIFSFFKSWVKNQKILSGLTVFSLFTATPLFFYTVPQSLANLIFIILIFFSLPEIINKQKIFFIQWLILAAIFFIHPLTGIPAFIWLSFWTIRGLKIKSIFKFLWGIICSVLLPLFFIILQKTSRGLGVSFKSENLLDFGQYLSDKILNYLPFYSVYHLLYFYGLNVFLLFIIIFVTGFIYLKNKDKELASKYLTLFLILLINLILISFINFQAVIDYEQLEFAKRFLQIISLAALPIFLIGLYFILRAALRLKFGNWIIIFFGSLILVFSLYLSYPHNDAMEKGRSYAVSKHDRKAVLVIEEDSSGQDYIVLANQSVSAAALREFGFKKYYQSNQPIFYYPIPTSSPLYEIYLDIIYNGVTREKIEKARELTGAKKVYLVVSSYWLDAKKRVTEAGMLTDNFINIEDKVWVFGF
ncbi:hypothetical protein GYA54_01980 [Candidatus Kuenenbacteria bacterium]|nr:hypothetical protein [Candidatus Kuenenbacteria bacterium]